MLRRLCKKLPTYAKKKISSVIKSLKDKLKYWKNKRKSNNSTKRKAWQFQSKVAEVKSQVQSCVDKIIVIIEARKQDVLDAVGNYN